MERGEGGEGARPRPDGGRGAEGADGGAGPSNEDDGAEDDYTYTYRGGEPPPPPPRPRAPRSGASSPDQDYLEMDFDPGPSCDAPEGEENDGDPSPEPPFGVVDPVDDAEESPPSDAGSPAPPSVSSDSSDSSAGPPAAPVAPVADVEPVRVNGRPFSSLIPHTTARGETVYVKRTVATWPAREGEGHRGGSGDLVSPGEIHRDDLSPERGATLHEESRANLSSALFHSTMAKRLVVDNHEPNFLQERDNSNADGEDYRGSIERLAPIEPVSKCMIWSEREACSKQITQIGTSACGATSVINALAALRITADIERVKSFVNTRQRANDAPLCRYIISRSIAGCGIDSLAAGLSGATDGAVTSRHFAMWPERKMSLSHWLAYWISLGGVPIATLNLQAGLTDPVRTPDSWHHQMIFGVGPRGIYMANPLECVEEGHLWHQLCSESILLIKRKDVLGRWTRNTNLNFLLNVPGDERWNTMNVLGQIVNMIRESQQYTSDLTRTTHIRIPACYSAGITIAVLTGSEAHKKLLSAPDLPLLYPDEDQCDHDY